MEFNQLNAFINVVSEGSFSRAASKLYLTQPTVSTHIKRLEKELGLVLFDRSRSEPLLTPAGKILYRYANDLLELREKALADVGMTNSRDEDTIVVAASSVPCQYLLPDVVAFFINNNPNMRVQLKLDNSHNVCTGVVSYEYSLGVVGERYNLPQLSFSPLLTDELVVAIPRQPEFEGLLSLKEVSFHDLTKYLVLLREEGSGTRSLLEKGFERAGYNISDMDTVVYDNQETIKQAVSKGLGISLLSHYVVEDYKNFGLLETRHLKEVFLKRHFYLAWHKKRILSPATLKMRDTIINYYNAGGGMN